MLVSKPTHGGGAPLGIDLDGGVAKIRIKAKPTEPADVDPAPDATPDAESVTPSSPIDQSPAVESPVERD